VSFSRRNFGKFLGDMVFVTYLISSPTASAADLSPEDDPLANFGRSLKSQLEQGSDVLSGRPTATTLLPPDISFADDSKSPQTSQGKQQFPELSVGQPGTLDGAMKEAAKGGKRQIGPLTHG